MKIRFLYVLVAGLFAAYFIGASLLWFKKEESKIIKAQPIRVLAINSPDSIIINPNSDVLPVMYTRIPSLMSMSAEKRKDRFIHLMLPSILLAKERMAYEKRKVKKLKERFDLGKATPIDSVLKDSLLSLYKNSTLTQLMEDLNPHPVSIILAQAIIESGWGTSRFFREANNVYGIWSYSSNEKRIKAFESRSGTQIYLRQYDSLYESVYDYLFTITRVSAYQKFRKARSESQDPFRLIWYLKNYSELRTEYVETLRNVIEHNDLHKYDSYKLVKIKQDDLYKKVVAMEN